MQLLRASVQLLCIQFLTFSCYDSVTLAGDFAETALQAGCKEPGFTCIMDENECMKMKLMCCNRMPVEEIVGMNTLRCPMPTPAPSYDGTGVPVQPSSNESSDPESGGNDEEFLSVRPVSYTIGPIIASTADVAGEVHPGDGIVGSVENTPTDRTSENKTHKTLYTLGLISVGALALVLAVIVRRRQNNERSETPREIYVIDSNDTLPTHAPVEYRSSTADNVRQSNSNVQNSLSESQVESRNTVNESALKPLASSLNTSHSERATSPFAKQFNRPSASGRPNGYVVDEENMSFPL